MNRSAAVAGPESQVLEQILQEAAGEDLTGLTDADLHSLSRRLWDWASKVPAGQQAVRVVPHAEGSGGRLGRSLLEATGPDMPFLVDSLLGECAAQGHEVKTMFHPVVTLADGRMISVIQIHTSPLTPEEERLLETGALATLADVARAVSDHAAMQARMRVEMKRLAAVQHVASAERDEAVAFLEWLLKDHYVFLGSREYEFDTDKDGRVLPLEPLMIEGSNLGILRNENLNVLSRDSEPLVLTQAIGDFIAQPAPLIIAKSTLPSRVHRRVPCDYIGVKKYDADGRVIGEVRFLGLFTAEAYDETARSIPFMRRRVQKVMAASGAAPGGHTEKALANLIETWPRDELFQTRSTLLGPMIMGALHLIGRPRTKVFLRRDEFDRFVTALVFVPRESYDTALRQRMGQVLTDAYRGKLRSFQPYFDAGPMARVHFEIGLTPGHPEPDAGEIENQIVELARTWDQGFRDFLMESSLTGADREGARGFIGAFNAAYREAFPPEEALRDVISMAELSAGRPVVARAYRLESDDPAQLRVKIFARNGAIALSRCVPVFENIGLFVHFETGYPVRPVAKPADDAPDTYWVHAVSMQPADGSVVDLDKLAHLFEDAFIAVWSGKAENDKFNRLVLTAGATWREAALIRALAAYRRQSGLDQPQDVQEAAVARYPAATRLILDLFRTRFDPKAHKSLEARTEAARKLEAAFEAEMKDVASLADDIVLRRLFELTGALQRTNFYQLDEDGAPPAWVSFKVASRELADLPEPKPYREIFTSSTRVEGVHLRFGPVARGGLRWSDRPSDYRTEVLGLVKAQQVKNAVIVPVGSKGGFYPKQLPPRTDPAWFESGRDAYKEFVTALLGLTDNLVKGKLVAPKDTVIWDGEDPYLVVAADKGTATFSDTANAISLEKGHWLGDAFASGGSAGYDHKKMGITARGAWEAVKRHFREMGKDIQKEPFTVIGVGDMSGDVFGNGMLLSPEIRLVAAFNHMHIFLDPNPDNPAASLAERQRMFDLPRSSWADYDAKLISRGGGIFPRTAKSIALTPEIKSLTGLSSDAVTPDELIHALLKSEADLLWFGGIGTYVKGTRETNLDAGDRANDAVRVNGRDLKVKVIGEGANLGMTQAGRIEFALAGGRLNTDAIDNSAGVDSSDHEVNIKILAAEAIRLGNLKDADRNALLAQMTDDVAHHVLAHNYDQSNALTLASATALDDHEALERLMVYLEERGVLNRSLEGLPTTTEMQTRKSAGHPLTRPELAVLLAWSKIVLFDDIVASELPDDPWFGPVLKAYFPPPIDGFSKAMGGHRLRREIIATVIANRTLDFTGPVALLRLRELTGAAPAEAVRALEASREVLDIQAFRAQIFALDTQVPADLQTALQLESIHAASEAAAWFIRATPGQPVGDAVKQTHGPLNELKASLASVQSAFPASRIERDARAFIKQGAPEGLARWAAAMSYFSQGLVVVDVARSTRRKVPETAACFYAIGDALRLDRLRASAREGLVHAPYWDRVAGRRLIAELVRLQAAAASEALSSGNADSWLTERGEGRRQLISTLTALGKDRSWSFAKFALSTDAVRQFMGR
ncbi:MAG: NAD-glutamate dehydrogenase [Hyphomonas sp.]|uniref:NAD-glutamate dehydrogenase n=1 Tax=Hyphomonas sp. TaxID=87 RepID=UPI00179796A1|nr:NAD-glutamate dehydrogenase [Hyphomonas sp.]MBA3068677.1 NAD-glutamate dehydrogenase [Hyphomonas sp.]MBU4063660.1 NAD-glutamate dehydrogenase [Alphaproteobacteria bacterium]MBU4165715.1 NAD-glutamate dehydrogenase [Alphaproteobacteria bacterium]